MYLSVYFPKLKIPASCRECSDRSVDYGGDCELMPGFHCNSFEDQYSLCPIKTLAERYGAIQVLPHDRLIEASQVYELSQWKWNEERDDFECVIAGAQIKSLPTIIPPSCEV